ncbi:nitroreductase family protein [Teredinibacter turnerae]|uniref:nitroreductase family protein n=1 Tax=Teredinibacter turnerae TaxID=2426 RepID=UPI00036EC3AC|nr:nitroreductase family protein [Teredinibacter turnerae]
MTDTLTKVGVAKDYQARTEHRLPDHFAASLGYLDWKTQPDPFRVYEGAEQRQLPLCEPVVSTPSWAELRANEAIAPAAALTINTFSQLLYDSLAISAWKASGSSRWALRCNPSSGNLHPTEAYVITGPVAELISQPALLHYTPKDHGVEVLRWLDAEPFAELNRQLPEGAFVLGLASIVWREAWKYGERAFRYCMHDVGHAMQAITFAARILGWRVRRVEGSTATQMDQLLGLERSSGPEAEHADVLLVIETCPTSTSTTTNTVSNTAAHAPIQLDLTDALLNELSPPISAQPNTLSTQHHPWPILAEVEQATRDSSKPHGVFDGKRCGSDTGNTDALGTVTLEVEANDIHGTDTSASARDIVRRRRSAVDFDGSTGMTREQLYRILSALVPSLTPSLWTAFPHQPRVHPAIYLHRIQGVEPGLAILVRNRADEPALRKAIPRVQTWEKMPGCPDELGLYRIMEGDARRLGRTLHCHQDIAADGALVTSMIASFNDELDRFGAPAWRYLHWEAGAVGQLLYLEAEALNLSATGIGCFFDTGVHELLGLKGGDFRMLYGTAIGRAVQDPRIQTFPAYQR